MADWALALAAFGLWLAGVGCGLVLVAWYARRTWRRSVAGGLDRLASLQDMMSTSSGPVKPPPPR